MSKLITVFGATGKQGGSVIRAIQADPALKSEFKIRGITRNVDKPAAKELEKQGIEMVAADMDSPASVATAVDGAHTVFLVTNYWEFMDSDREYTQGRNVADAAKAGGVQHLIFSSLIHVREATAGRLSNVPHFDGKALIERYIRQLAIPCTFVMPGYFMSNMEQSILKQDDGSYMLTLPVTETAQLPMFDEVNDSGKFVAAALKHRDELIGRNLHAATDYFTPDRVVEEFSEVTGKKAKFMQVTPDEFVKFFPEAIGKEMVETHLLLDGPGYYLGADLAKSHKFLDDKKPTPWKEFVAKSNAWK